MSKHNLQIEEKVLKIALKAKSLTYIAITPHVGQNVQLTAGNIQRTIVFGFGDCR